MCDGMVRSLTVADGLRAAGADIDFICRDHNGNLMSAIEARGHEVLRLPPTDEQEICQHERRRSNLPPHADWLAPLGKGTRRIAFVLWTPFTQTGLSSTGLSDHTLENTTAVASVALGARIIEKHFTLDRNGGGHDDSFSLEPADMMDLCVSSKRAWSSLGRIDYGRKPSEGGNVKFRRSLYFVKNLKAGEIITADAVRSVRPGFGLAPKRYKEVVGAVLLKDAEAFRPVTLAHIQT